MESWRSAKKSYGATRAPSGWERYKAENSLTGMKITTGKLIYSLQRTVLRQGIVKREHL